MNSTTGSKWLEHRTNNDYDTILLVVKDECGTYVVGAWTTDRNDGAWANYQSPGDLGDWQMTQTDCDDPDGYGDLVSSKTGS